MRFIFLILVGLYFAIPSVSAQSYRFHPGDTLQVSVSPDSKYDRQVVIAPDGSFAFAPLGHLKAGGRTATQIEEAIRDKLSTIDKRELTVTVSFLSKREANASVREPEPVEIAIFVMGEVQKPGQFTIKKRTTLLQALALGGGLSPFAAQRRIQVHRKVDGQDEVHDFDYRAFERGQDATGNIFLRPGDVVVVPERGLFE